MPLARQNQLASMLPPAAAPPACRGVQRSEAARRAHRSPTDRGEDSSIILQRSIRPASPPAVKDHSSVFPTEAGHCRESTKQCAETSTNTRSEPQKYFPRLRHISGFGPDKTKPSSLTAALYSVIFLLCLAYTALRKAETCLVAYRFSFATY